MRAAERPPTSVNLPVAQHSAYIRLYSIWHKQEPARARGKAITGEGHLEPDSDRYRYDPAAGRLVQD